MVKKLYTALILIPILLIPLNTQNLVEEDPDKLGFNLHRMQRIDNIIQQAVKNGEIPGAVALIARNGKIAYHKSFGYSDIQSKKKMNLNSIFRIASMTKAITSVGIMILYERGYLCLNDPISKYLPEFKSQYIIEKNGINRNGAKKKYSKNEIKIIDLLNHSSGISYPFIKNNLQKIYKEAGIIDGLTEKKIYLKDQMKLLSTLPLMFKPGSKYQYGLNSDVLGYLCQVISKKSLDKFFETEIFKPLGMKDTHFYLPIHKKNRLVKLYSWVKNKGLVLSKGDESDIKLDNPNYPVTGARTYFSGGAGLSSTAIDYAKFIQMLLNKGKFGNTQIISRKSVELMSTPRIDWDNDNIADFGFGFYIVTNIAKEGNISSKGAYGWSGAFYTYFWIDPKENLITIFMSQLRPNKTKIAKKFKIMVYQALK